jgi:hypothetical protein
VDAGWLCVYICRNGKRRAVRAAGCSLAQLQYIWGEGLPVGGTRAVLRARLEAAAPPCAQPPAQ